MYTDSGISAPATPGGHAKSFRHLVLSKLQVLGQAYQGKEPRPLIVFQNPGNGPNNPSGQSPGVSTRCYSHGMIATLNRKHVHVFDSHTNKGSFVCSLQTNNVCEAFSVEGYFFE